MVRLQTLLSILGMLAVAPTPSASQSVVSSVCQFHDCVRTITEIIYDQYKRREPDIKDFLAPTEAQLIRFSDEIGAEILERNEVGALFSSHMTKVEYLLHDGTTETSIVFHGVRFHGFGANAPDAIFKGELFAEDGFLLPPQPIETEEFPQVRSVSIVPTAGFWLQRDAEAWVVRRISTEKMNESVRRAYNRSRAIKATRTIVANEESISALVQSAQAHLELSKTAIQRSDDADFISRVEVLDASIRAANAKISKASSDLYAEITAIERAKKHKWVDQLIGVAELTAHGYDSLIGDKITKVNFGYSEILRNIEEMNNLSSEKRMLIGGKVETTIMPLPLELRVESVNLGNDCCNIEEHSVKIFSITK